MEIYISGEKAAEIIDIASSFNLDARIVGRCEPSESKKLTIITESGKFDY